MKTHKSLTSRALLIATESERAAEAFALAADEAWEGGQEEDAMRLCVTADTLREQAQSVREML